MNATLPYSQQPVIIGAGLAGLSAALSFAPMPVILLAAAPLGNGSASGWAQGGIAAALGADDRAELHAEDTLAAGAGLCDPVIARLVTMGASGVIAWLAACGAPFDRDGSQLNFGLEAAHSRRRIVHAGGDATGRRVMETLIAAVRATPSVTVIENAIVTNLVAGDAGIEAVVFEQAGTRKSIAADRVLLASGGAGALWKHTTNPAGSWGSGLALAARAGAALADLEFMQFHPTAIDIGPSIDGRPMPLASEALRGEGAALVDETGARFTDELKPRDIVTRAMWAHMQKGHRLFLDACAALGPRFPARFPSIYAICSEAGIDPVSMPIPVRPAAHYHMGGVAVDAKGRSSVEGLWACGEVASTGLHGANRLASNSLLEAAFFGRRAAEDMKGVALRKTRAPNSLPIRAAASGAENIRAIMSAHVGVLREKEGLEAAVAQLAPAAPHNDRALAALLIATAALRREESRGSHARTDFPAAAQAKRQFISLEDVSATLPPAKQRPAARARA